jgi:hypothetical protein
MACLDGKMVFMVQFRLPIRDRAMGQRPMRLFPKWLDLSQSMKGLNQKQVVVALLAMLT